MRAYISVFKMRLRMELQYRGAMIGGILCQMFFGLVLVAVYRALYDSKPQSLPIESVVTYVWLQQAFFRMMFGTDSDLLDKISSGDISYDMCRPINMYGFYYRGYEAYGKFDACSANVDVGCFSSKGMGNKSSCIAARFPVSHSSTASGTSLRVCP